MKLLNVLNDEGLLTCHAHGNPIKHPNSPLCFPLLLLVFV